MITNHEQFLAAIRQHKLVRIAFYSLPDNGVVDRECAPLDYSPSPGAGDTANRYWVWDRIHSAGTNPLGLSPDQIVSLEVLGKDFDPASYPTAEALRAAPPRPTPLPPAAPPAAADAAT